MKGGFTSQLRTFFVVIMLILIISILSLIIWVYLIFFRGNFWLSNQFLQPSKLDNLPSICVIIPARNEAEVLPLSLPSILNQDYPGKVHIILIDDQSTDHTGEIAKKIGLPPQPPLERGEKCNDPPQPSLERGEKDQKNLTVINGQSLPTGWSGKLWAMEQGVKYAQDHFKPDYFLFTDADIKHDYNNLSQLVAKAENDHLDLVSLMVLLRCDSFWEKLLIPAFIFFFEKLYPFPWVNNSRYKTAAAAGGCILIRFETLQRIGGLQVLRNALIDDCSLASAVKSTLPENRGIWLGLTQTTVSLRVYPSLTSIWDMVARTAFTQLNYSVWLLMGTVIGMFLTYLTAPLGLIFALVTGNLLVAIASSLTWLLMAICYYPTLRLYQLSLWWSFTLPVIAFLYNLMTIDSALRHWYGKGGQWKGRIYQINNEQ
jgi:hopene-associated glycosyltransferase HpnB